ncbi:MAG: hypothetical protein ACD_42C00517G0001 [uncultured bacterium]|nr:MAG: hypothetical protein ACD_42C00517G0001 [uncultured bacterium]OGT25137.1 MAG: hypothetical protein A3B71_00200 [Gammaproteobacteria bacterium RIFCSPHIGHO2_02_FULL_42_43]OGT50960.1 MAG: hypothetical protein A3E54_00030 [Gammaproteobacteria bacterium RIFCSPHIGHO2_12_FULL_41_25]OGT63066.1 MAG: hypothetical protein A3I77_08780 [Gammaproteobacteria bacterium RIFCSPLOWO2_02_FULL_42_14]OGT85641.1 MAG: hypothetical protein A3G86_00030 [Gammaproteobacteria bacterium RIFCSPLOWO2_12_FULL_42_18]
MHRRIKWIIGIFLFIFFATFIFYGVKLLLIQWYTAHYQEPPVTVSAQAATLETWHPMLTTVGTLKASNGVNVNSEVNGQVLSLHFQSGDHVQKGNLLVQLNDDVDQQTLQRDQAKLHADELDFQRKEILLKQNAVSESALDAARASYLQSKAAVASDNVMIEKKKIRAPFAGKIGIRQVDIGQYITSGTSIVTLQALDPMFVDFSLPEQDLPRIQNGQTITVKVDAYPNRTFEGKIIAINSLIDVNTRSIAVRASIPNSNEILYPGLFANVDVVLPELQKVITVPQSAITYSLYGDSAYVVEQKSKDKKGNSILIAVQKFVTVGERRNNIASIVQGIAVGDSVVTSGQLKLHPNAQVIINNKVAPT